jgi:hypothetical protein
MGEHGVLIHASEAKLWTVIHETTGAEDKELSMTIKTHKVHSFYNLFSHKTKIGVGLGNVIF